MRIALLLLAATATLALSACSAIPVERSYSLNYRDPAGREIGSGITLRPPAKAGLAK